jgi:hypothetical protein
MVHQPRRTAEVIIIALIEVGSDQVSPKLHPREEQFRIPRPRRGLLLFLRYLPPSRATELRRTIVYVSSQDIGDNDFGALRREQPHLGFTHAMGATVMIATLFFRRRLAKRAVSYCLKSPHSGAAPADVQVRTGLAAGGNRIRNVGTAEKERQFRGRPPGF